MVYARVSTHTYIWKILKFKAQHGRIQKRNTNKIQGTDMKFWGRTEEKIRARIVQVIEWLWLCSGCLENYGSFCSTGKRLLLSPECQDQLWNPPTFYSLTTSATSQVVKRSGCKDDHSHSFSAEVKNEWKYTSIPHTSPSCAQAQL